MVEEIEFGCYLGNNSVRRYAADKIESQWKHQYLIYTRGCRVRTYGDLTIDRRWLENPPFVATQGMGLLG